MIILADEQQAADESLKQFIPEVHFELIPIRNLLSNQDYQRNLSQHHVEKAAKNLTCIR